MEGWTVSDAAMIGDLEGVLAFAAAGQLKWDHCEGSLAVYGRNTELVELLCDLDYPWDQDRDIDLECLSQLPEATRERVLRMLPETLLGRR